MPVAKIVSGAKITSHEMWSGQEHVFVRQLIIPFRASKWLRAAPYFDNFLHLIMLRSSESRKLPSFSKKAISHIFPPVVRRCPYNHRILLEAVRRRWTMSRWSVGSAPGRYVSSVCVCQMRRRALESSLFAYSTVFVTCDSLLGFVCVCLVVSGGSGGARARQPFHFHQLAL